MFYNITGDCIEDRKSVFQGHFAHVETANDVKAVISKLMENRKFANATHNMYAYRIKQAGGNCKFHFKVIWLFSHFHFPFSEFFNLALSCKSYKSVIANLISPLCYKTQIALFTANF